MTSRQSAMLFIRRQKRGDTKWGNSGFGKKVLYNAIWGIIFCKSQAFQREFVFSERKEYTLCTLWGIHEYQQQRKSSRKEGNKQLQRANLFQTQRKTKYLYVSIIINTSWSSILLISHPSYYTFQHLPEKVLSSSCVSNVKKRGSILLDYVEILNYIWRMIWRMKSKRTHLKIRWTVEESSVETRTTLEHDCLLVKCMLQKDYYCDDVDEGGEMMILP